MATATDAPSSTGDGSGTEDKGSNARVGGALRWRIPVTGDGIDYRPHRLRSLWRSSIGKKYVVAITGAIMAIWVVLHMLGNLKEIEGPGGGHAAIDRYAHFLHTVGGPVAPNDMVLWIVRGILIVAFALHVTAISQLWRRNVAAKPRGHRARRVRSSVAARSMTVSGTLILAFLVFHILHFTLRAIHPTRLTESGVYANVYGAFHDWWLVVIYVGAVVLLGLHLWHGLWSGAQTSGLDNPDRNWFWRRMAAGVTLFTVVGFAIVPILVATDSVPAPTGAQTAASR